MGPAPAQVERLHRLSVADFHRLGAAGVLDPSARVELVEGQILDMTPIGTVPATIVADLTQRLVLAAGARALVWCQNPIVLDEHSEVQPDLALLQPRRQAYLLRHPRPADVLLVVEVADTSLRYDQQVKVPLYARCGIPEVWLVDTAAAVLSRYRTPAPHGYAQIERIAAPGIVRPAAMDEIAIDLSGLFGS